MISRAFNVFMAWPQGVSVRGVGNDVYVRRWSQRITCSNWAAAEAPLVLGRSRSFEIRFYTDTESIFDNW